MENGIMCGYCTEQIAISALKASSPFDAQTVLPRLALDMYLEEVRDLSGVLQQLNIQNVMETWLASIILCRTIQILVMHGFESAVYQGLLQQPQFISLITVACEKGAEAALSDLDTHLNPSAFSWLLEKNTYLMPECFEQHNNESSEQTCTTLLNGYVDWWLEEGSIPHQDLDQIFKDTGILDPIEGIPESERLLLGRRFAALWFALLRTSCQPASAEILWKIITRNPSGIPHFNGLDLWLQRRAALAYYDQYGLAPLLSESKSVRVELFQYLAATRIFKLEEKNSLLEAMSGPGFVFSGEDWQWADSP
jgi:hypothetical protein